MGNVIHVDFTKKNVAQEVSDVDSGLIAYLDDLSEMGVDDEDILEVIDAILDKDAYFAADEVVQEFADGWLHKFL